MEKPVTVKQLREALDGVPDDVEVWTTCVAHSGGRCDSPVLKIESELMAMWRTEGRQCLVLVIEDW